MNNMALSHIYKLQLCNESHIHIFCTHTHITEVNDPEEFETLNKMMHSLTHIFYFAHT